TRNRWRGCRGPDPRVRGGWSLCRVEGAPLRGGGGRRVRPPLRTRRHRRRARPGRPRRGRGRRARRGGGFLRERRPAVRRRAGEGIPGPRRLEGGGGGGGPRRRRGRGGEAGGRRRGASAEPTMRGSCQSSILL